MLRPSQLMLLVELREHLKIRQEQCLKLISYQSMLLVDFRRHSKTQQVKCVKTTMRCQMVLLAEGKVLEANTFSVDAIILGRTSRAVEDRAGKVLEDKNALSDGAVSGTSRAVEGTAAVKNVLEENIPLVVAVGRTCWTLV